jgi:hypothetical protein
VILPPSIHENGSKYEWTTRIKPAPIPAWLVALLAEPARPRSDSRTTDQVISEGRQNQHLASLAGSMRRPGMSQPAIEKALLEENRLRCEPPLPESEVRKVAASVARYEPAVRNPASPSSAQNPGPVAQAPWTAAESMAAFLSDDESGAEFLDSEKRLIARSSITQLFSPPGLGKSLYALWLALCCALRGLRVLLLDRDNPRHVVRGRLRSFGADLDTKDLKVLTREKCPPLTNALAWASFPYGDYDLVILGSLDSAAEGIGEQDSSKPSKAIAPLLDIARRENGPAVLILGNTVKTAQHSRGSGVIEDRSDIVYEVRDATDFHFKGDKPCWVDALPPADAACWAGRSSRRPTFGGLANHYINHGLPFNKRNGHRKAKGTIYCYQHVLEDFLLPRWREDVAAKIKPLAIRDWLFSLHDEDDYDWQTVSKIKMVMGQVFDHADVHDLETCRNPVSKVRVPGSEDDDKEVRILQPEETWRIISRLEDPERTLVLLIAATGLRISEALGL